MLKIYIKYVESINPNQPLNQINETQLLHRNAHNAYVFCYFFYNKYYRALRA